MGFLDNLFGKGKAGDRPDHDDPAQQAAPSAAAQAQQTPATEQPAEPGPPWTGRPLGFRREATVENVPALAEDFVDAVEHIEGVRLDYSVESLALVDDVLEQFREPGSDRVAETIFTAGCYVGEVLVRQSPVPGYEWRRLDPSDRIVQVLGFPLVLVHTATGSATNPIGKAFKRVDEGAADSVRFYADAQLAADARRES